MVRSLHVLLVEDDPVIARAMLRQLRSGGVEAELAVDKRSALALDLRCQVAVIDLNLPDGSGLELHEELQRSGQAPIPIFFSATSDPREIASARARGTFVAKSSGVEAVVELVKGILKDASCDPPAPESSTRPSSSEPLLDTPSSTRASADVILPDQKSETTSDAITKTK